MKLSLICWQCTSLHGINSSHIYKVQVNDLNTYEYYCKDGHKNIVVHEEDKFVMLFDIAINAIADGYYREAIASSAASLERFYEYFLKVICHANSISSDEYLNSWSLIKNQSERQIGSFTTIYLLHFNKTAKLMDSKNVSFRNEVIHKGRIPTKDESINFLNLTLELIVPDLLLLKQKNKHSIDAINQLNFEERQKSLEKRTPMSMNGGTTISVRTSHDWIHPKSINERLKAIEDSKASQS